MTSASHHRLGRFPTHRDSCLALRFLGRYCLAVCLLAIGFAAQSASGQDRWRTDTASAAMQPLGTNTNLGWPGSGWLGGASQNRPQWHLGIRGQNTQTGVLIQEVERNSAADLAKLQPGDRILNVDGFQVGSVGGRVYDLPEELNRRADSAGQVPIILQDRVTGRLVNLTLQLTSSADYIVGVVTLGDRTPLPADALLTVRIENASRPYLQVSQQNNTYPVNSSGRMAFEVSYDPAYIDPQDIYHARATIRSGGRVIMDSSATQNVITRGSPKRANLQVVGVDRFSGVATGTTPGTTVAAGYPNYNYVSEEITKMYRRYLGRSPTTLELAALQSTPGIADRLPEFPLELMAAQEYFDRAGNNSTVWLQAVFTEIVGKQPDQGEMQQWLARLQQLRNSRTELLRQLEYAANRSRTSR